jgi:cathepsin L
MRAVVIATVTMLAVAAMALPQFEFDHMSGRHYTFEQYEKDFNKEYVTEALRLHHKRVFLANFQKIKDHNHDKSRSYRQAVNKFTDMSDGERRTFLGTRVTNLAEMMGLGERIPSTADDLPNIPLEALPAAVDWRTANPPIITPPKDQASCGSCWAHAATESVETYVAMATGQLLTLSRQNLVDCVPNPNDCGGFGGCNGATAELGFAFVASNGGMATEAQYPYHAVNQPCQTGAAKVATVSGFKMLPQNDYGSLMTAVATIGPMAINADASPWFSYSSGVFDGCSFDNIDINHVIQLVGYGTDSASGQDYWWVRNSWSAGWGESGYIRLQRHSDGTSKWCGPDTSPQDGVGCNGGPSNVTVCGSCGIWYDTSYPVGGALV